ncbi:MAG TPA: glycosyl transferase, partial [Mycolicibacterium fallax]|nr:glycosyl transferase [Mycolicibacterium fallax]
MRVAVVAGPDPGHALPALALCLKFAAAGDDPILLTGRSWLDTAREAGITATELLGLDVTDEDDDSDQGEKIHR